MRNLSTYDIAEKLECSQTNVRYWLRKYGLTTLASANNNLKCVTCGAALKGKRTKYCKAACKPGDNANSYKAQKKRGQTRKIKLIRLHGGCCNQCGYRKNYAALAFHHLDPENKVFNIDIRKCSNTNWKTLLQEVEKCIVLCHNCHAELHHPDCLI